METGDEEREKSTSEGLSVAKYEGPKMVDERKKIGKADQMLCRLLQSKGNRLKQCNRIRAA